MPGGLLVEYENFDIRIGGIEPHGPFFIEVSGSPGGSKTDRPVWQQFPLDDDDFNDLVVYLNDLIAGPGDAEELGRRLTRLLFPKKVRELFVARRAVMRDKKKGLRIRLQIDSPTLSRLPWEYCYSEDDPMFLAQSRETPLVRYIAHSLDEGEISLPETVKVLLAIAIPSDQESLDHEQEEERIRKILSDLGDRADLRVLKNPSQHELQLALNQYKPHIFHFVGHGLIQNGQAALALVGEDTDKTVPLDEKGLSPMMKDSGVLVAVLNACYTALPDKGAGKAETEAMQGIGPSLIRAGIPAVLAMQTTVPDKTAVSFARDFYTYLAAGISLEAAVTEMRIGAYSGASDKYFWGIPVLYMRPSGGVVWPGLEEKQETENFVVTIPEMLRPYLQVLARKSSRLNLQPLVPPKRAVPVFTVDQLFLDLDTNLRHQTQSHPRPNWQVTEEFSAAVAHIHSKRECVVIGEPGSGKTTLLRFLTYCLAQAALGESAAWLERLRWSYEPVAIERLNSDRTDESSLAPVLGDENEYIIGEERKETHWTIDLPIPVYIDLREFVMFAERQRNSMDHPWSWHEDPKSLWQFVCHRLKEQERLEEAISPIQDEAAEGNLIFLLDGVDQVSIDNRPKLWKAIRAFADGPYGNNRWVATCRTRSFVAEDVPTRVLPALPLVPLGGEQIDTFISCWYETLENKGVLSSEAAAKMKQDLYSATRHPHLRPLARNPMLLTIMAITQTERAPLLDERIALYQACIETLFLRWQRHKEAELGELPSELARFGLTKENCEKLLWEIAWEGYQVANREDDTFHIPEIGILKIARRHLGSFCEAEKFLEYLEKRTNLVAGDEQATERTYTFTYRIIQDYLAARHLVSGSNFRVKALELAGQDDARREVLKLSVQTLVFNPSAASDVPEGVERALDAVAKVLPRRTPATDDLAGWQRVWLAAQMALAVGLKELERDELGRELLPDLRDQLVALLQMGRLTPHKRAEATVALGWLGDIRNDVSCNIPETVKIPAGSFHMGSDPETDRWAFAREGPLHQVELPPYRIGKYPVTVAQYRDFVDAGGYRDESYWTEAGWLHRLENDWVEPAFWSDPRWTVPNHSVVGVSWYEAVAFCNWLKSSAKRDFRLPDEAMWEKAMRGTDGRIYPWGNEWPWAEELRESGLTRTLYLNSTESQIGQTTGVGAFPKGVSPFGVYDAVGGVWEWCSGCNPERTPYPFVQKTYEQDLEAEGDRIWRGGSYEVGFKLARVAYRYARAPHRRFLHVGFRVAEEKV